MHATSHNSLSAWQSTHDKSNSMYWDSRQFLHEYASNMEHYIREYVTSTTDDVIACIKDLQGNPRPQDNLFDNLEQNLQQSSERLLKLSIWSSQPPVSARTSGLTVRVLSLGCGPGIDLAAIVKILSQDRRVGCVECVGIDLRRHPMSYLAKQLEDVAGLNRELQIRFKNFSGVDMHDFAQFCQVIGMKFDLVSARYINAIMASNIFCGPVPRLLGDVGRVLLLDNFSNKLASLTSFGYIDRVDKRLLNNQIFLVYQKPRSMPKARRSSQSESLDSSPEVVCSTSSDEEPEQTPPDSKKRTRLEYLSSNTADEEESLDRNFTVSSHDLPKIPRFQFSSSDDQSVEVSGSAMPDEKQDGIGKDATDDEQEEFGTSVTEEEQESGDSAVFDEEQD